MAFLQKLHGIAGKIDPVVKAADRHNLTPSFLYPLPKPDAPINRPVTEAGKAKVRAGQVVAPVETRRRKASALVGSAGRGLLSGP